MLLASPVTVHDVKDVEAFVRAMIVKTRLKLERQERDELVCEGIAILLDLAKKFKPHMAGYDRPGSFAGYCSKYLPLKIVTAYHRWHPENLLQPETDGETGKVVKRYAYGETAASLDERLERDESVDSDRLRQVGDFVRA